MEQICLDAKQLENKKLDIVIFPSDKKAIWESVGYTFDEEGFLIDNSNKKRVKAQDGDYINIHMDKDFAMIGGSHIFVRNLADFSQYLSEKGLLKFRKRA